jgi:hypothetical protein
VCLCLRANLLLEVGWMEHLHPHTRPHFYRLLVFITSNTVLNYLPIYPTQNMSCVLLQRSIIKEDCRGKGGWLLGGPAKERGDDQVASTSPDVFSPLVSFPWHNNPSERPYPPSPMFSCCCRTCLCYHVFN